MRWVAKNIVAAGLASRCEVQVAYAIGKAQPVGLYVETFGTETVDAYRIQNAIPKVFDLRPAAIIEDLDLLRPIYAPTAAYGHFGRISAAASTRPSPGSAPTGSSSYGSPSRAEARRLHHAAYISRSRSFRPRSAGMFESTAATSRVGQ